jgi:hypothetical protein
LSFIVRNIQTWFDSSGVEARILAASGDAARQCAELMADLARAYAPYDATRSAGENDPHLRDTIQVVSEANGLVHHVIATAPHAEPQEFGFVHWISGKFIKPKFYMRRAAVEAGRQFPQFLKQAAVRQGFHHQRVMGATFRGG